jgi:hypothetical protein
MGVKGKFVEMRSKNYKMLRIEQNIAIFARQNYNYHERDSIQGGTKRGLSGGNEKG